MSNTIIESILSEKTNTSKDLRKLKIKLSREFKYKGLISNSEILNFAKTTDKDKLQLLLKKPVRTLSGVAIVAVMCPPHKCPGDCIYCPNVNNAPRSYTGREPAAMRAEMFDFDAYKQTSHRLKQLKAIGHNTSKVEIIIMGGTFPSIPYEDQKLFVKNIFDALNDKISKTLQEAQKLNETSDNRCVGLTIETRPDNINNKTIDNFLEIGATRIELGVQTTENKVYIKVKRGHTIDDVRNATQILKNAGYKVCYHYMPGLFVSKKEDISNFKKLFDDETFRPDMLKLYPVLVTENTGLYELWKKGEFEPYTNEDASEVISKMKTSVPDYVRIMRIQRDIPAQKIKAGVTAGNLREHVKKYLENNNEMCHCIRCREAGHKGINTIETLYFNEESYNASEGKEYFISADSKDIKDHNNNDSILFGYLRLRLPITSTRDEITKNTAIVRELKVVGKMTKIGNKDKNVQHMGIGQKLMKIAENIAKKGGKNKIVVISAVGTREYYRHLGYKDDGPYMSKIL
ncbi:MAG: tRNA uridine(34) 5-carboxymethylaminomethyl modification radical SAM/GNAT enzyme Elp3 [DPANN group archaeon]|nr:tRNA uridine(34) 5-carboxymethylaminomethyl modification radical SAM/GNAT enzyme Elp3 [DPANN group archaeon]